MFAQNPILMRFLVAFLLLVLSQAVPQTGLAQTSFSLLPDSVYASKPKTNFVMYNYGQFQNLTADTLAMRWVKTYVEVDGNGPNADLGNWTIGVQDPSTWHNPANALDSADFLLPPASGAFDKLILQLYPHGTAGHLVVHFKVFPIANPGDTALIVYDFTSTEVASSSTDPTLISALELFPNPASTWLILRSKASQPLSLQIVSPLGQVQRQLELPALMELKLDLTGWPAGLWWVRVVDDGSFGAMPFLLER